MEYDNNHFIIASRAYSLQARPQTRSTRPAAHGHHPKSLIAVLLLSPFFLFGSNREGHRRVREGE
jgi:hypothetical protein